MAEIFAGSGGVEGNFSIPAPRLLGDFIPGIDIPDFQDGFGLVTPLGGGPTTRRYQPYGVSTEYSWQDTQLQGLQFPSAGGISYSFEGLIGPQGIPGRDGIAGVTTIIGLPAFNSNFLTALPHNIDEINDLGTAAGKMIYTSAYTTTVDIVWENKAIAAINSWNDSDINTDASFFIVVADAGIYVSTNDGDSWDNYDPRSEAYNQVYCASSGGKAAVMGNDSRKEGVVLVTSNYGVNWVEKIVTV